ncbi:MAG: PP2C family protein-serine/threonine phosphatase, partial [Chthoniobacterales bacterium]
DVSGKGIPASLLMAQILSAMQFVFATTTSPSNALSTLNATLHEQIVRGMFATTLVGRMTPDSRRIEISSAGHCRPWLVRANEAPIEILTEGALPLGVMPQVSYRQGKVELAEGDYLMCYTDGLSESRNPGSGQFFEDLIGETLTRKFAQPQEIVDLLVTTEERFREGSPARDDLTLLVAGFR